mgnify:CR=1 FL=1
MRSVQAVCQHGARPPREVDHDLGMALHGLMLAAEAHGLASCAIGAMASWPDLIRAELGLDGHTAIVCGMAIGHADPDAPVNRTVTAAGTREQWVYGGAYVYLDSGRVTAWQN